MCDFKSKEVVKVIWHKAASPPHTDGSIVFARRRQCAPHLVHQIGIHTVPVMILLNRVEYIDRRTHPAGMSWTGQFFALKIASASTSNTQFPSWTHQTPHPKLHLDRSSNLQFLHNSRQRVTILYNGRPFSPQNLPLRVGDLDPVSSMVPCAHPSSYPEQHLDRFSSFAGITIATGRQTDHATPSVAIGRINVVLRCGLR